MIKRNDLKSDFELPGMSVRWICYVSKVKYLGIVFGKKLTFESNITYSIYKSLENLRLYNENGAILINSITFISGLKCIFIRECS